MKKLAIVSLIIVAALALVLTLCEPIVQHRKREFA